MYTGAVDTYFGFTLVGRCAEWPEVEGATSGYSGGEIEKSFSTLPPMTVRAFMPPPYVDACMKTENPDRYYLC